MYDIKLHPIWPAWNIDDTRLISTEAKMGKSPSSRN